MKNMQTEFKWALITNKQKIQQKQQQLAVSTWPIDWVVELIGNGKLTNWQIATTTKKKQQQQKTKKTSEANSILIKKKKRNGKKLLCEKSRSFIEAWLLFEIFLFSAICYCILFNWFLLLYNQVVAELVLFINVFFFLPGNKCTFDFNLSPSASPGCVARASLSLPKCNATPTGHPHDLHASNFSATTAAAENGDVSLLLGRW